MTSSHSPGPSRKPICSERTPTLLLSTDSTANLRSSDSDTCPSWFPTSSTTGPQSAWPRPSDPMHSLPQVLRLWTAHQPPRTRLTMDTSRALNGKPPPHPAGSLPRCGLTLNQSRTPDGTTLLTDSADHHIRSFIL